MSQNSSNPPNRSWKQADRTAPTAQQGKRKWQQETVGDQKPVGPGMKRAFKIFLAFGSFAGLIGLLIWLYILFRPISPAGLILVGSGYEENLTIPHNAHGWKGLVDVAGESDKDGFIPKLPWDRSGKLHLLHGPAEPDAGNGWDKIWAKVKGGGFREKTIVLFLSLHGGADENGPFLLANDTSATSKIGVEKDILEALKSPELQNKNILLILDATQVESLWPAGMLFNDFARSLKRLEDRIQKIPGLVVFCASDENQRSWLSEQWQQTIFAHYLLEGLKGAADGSEGSRDRRVTALELFKYVKGKVKDWASSNRDAVQTPLLLGNQDVARTMELVQIDQDYSEEPASAAPGRTFSHDEDLKSMWKECRALRNQVPSPAVYNPHSWRAYQDTVLRCEQLMRVGDPTKKVSSLQNRLSQLKSQIQDSRQVLLTPASLTTSLTAPAMLGVSAPWAENEWLPLYRQVLSSSDAAKRQGAWKELEVWGENYSLATNSVHRGLLEIQLGREVLKDLKGRQNLTHPELDESVDLLKKWIHEKLGSNPGPVEAHFTTMLKYKEISPPTPPPARDLQLAIEVRLLAEQVAVGMVEGMRGHPYSEVVWPWIASRIQKADELRRQGEDWLFGSDDRAWQQARRDLESAKKIYVEAGQDARIVRGALEVRDQVLADLPYYAAWVGSQPQSGDEGRNKVVADWTQKVLDLGSKMDSLVDRLRKPEPEGRGLQQPLPADNDHPQPRPPLAKLSEEINSDLGSIAQEFQEKCRTFAGEGADLQGYLHEMEAVLSIPLLDDPDLRSKVLRESRQISGRLHEERSRFAGITSDGNELARRARLRAQRQGKMALAVAGEPWDQSFSRDQLRGRIQESTPEGWTATLGAVGKQVGDHLQKQRAIIREGWDNSLKEMNLAKAAELLQVPEQFCRLVCGGVGLEVPVSPFNPVQAIRRLRMHDLLVGLQDRTVKDHWFTDAIDPNQTYYKPAAQAYLKDALKLAEARPEEVVLNSERQKPLKVLQQRLEKQEYLWAESNPVQHFTSEQKFDLVYKLQAKPGVPPGIPMVWLDSKENQDRSPFKEITGTKYTDRRPVQEALPKAVAYILESNLQNPSKSPPLIPKVEEGKLSLRGVFRGQRLRQEVNIQVHSTAELIVRRFPHFASMAHVSVQMEPDVFYGAISIVLDLSGSMDEPLGKNNLRKKIEYAREALKEVLEKIPEGTYLSVQVFGYQTNPLQNKQADVKETKISWIRKTRPWVPETQKKQLLNSINDLVPMNYTPIAESLKIAKEEGFPDENVYKGPKVLLALTDGSDTMFQGNIPDFLKKQFDNSGVEVNILCFSQDEKELADARKQFESVKKLDPPGKFKEVTESLGLSSELENSMRPKLRLFRKGQILRGFEDGLVARPIGYNLNPTKIQIQNPSGEDVFEVRIQKTSLPQVRLRSGDYLIITLARDPRTNQIIMKQTICADRWLKNELLERNRKRQGGWSVAFLQNQATTFRGGELDRLLVVEDVSRPNPDPRDIVQITPPGFMWLELRDGAGKQPAGVRWHNVYGYCAPAYFLRSGPAELSKQDLQLWWSESFPLGSRFTTTISHDPQKEPLVGDSNRPVEINDTKVMIEKVTVEDRWVTISSGKEPQKRPCLVVQVQYKPGQPVWIQPTGLNHQGEEHHFFTEAGKYTAIFWDVQGTNIPFRLHVLSLNGFKTSPTTLSTRLVFPEPNTSSGPDPLK